MFIHILSSQEERQMSLIMSPMLGTIVLWMDIIFLTAVLLIRASV